MEGFRIVILVLLIIHLCFGDIPLDWKARIDACQMLFSNSTNIDPHLYPAIGNGNVATIVTSDTIYMAGVFNGVNVESPSHRARIPSTINIDVTSSSFTFIGAAIDFERGVFYKRYQSSQVQVEQRSYAHRKFASLLIHEIEIKKLTQSSSSVTITLKSNPGPASSDIDFKLVISNPNLRVMYGSIDTPEENYSPKVEVAVATSPVPTQIVLPSNSQSQTFYFISAFRNSLDSSNATDQSIKDFNNAVAQQSSLLDSHQAACQEMWKSRIEITGDKNLAFAINSSLYYILSSIREDYPWSLSPGSLATNGYNGHSFWDCETWMYPPILILHPNLAKSLIQYRFNLIPGAERKAKSYHLGYQGTMFPWESAFTGEEVCPFNIGTCIYEQHITGDIAFSLLQYWRATHDRNWLENIAWPLASNISTFWASRVKYDNSLGVYTIDEVIPPDEYHFGNNSVFTNAIASLSLNATIYFAKLLGKSYPSNWSDIARKIKIPFDNARQIHLEYDGYTNQVIKQADVILLGFPMMYDMPQKIRFNDLEFYSGVSDSDGPAMTWSMTAIGYIDLGSLDKASKYFAQSYANIHPPFNVWLETPSGGAPMFITGAGGFLQGVLFGYGGLRLVESEELIVNPNLPPNTQEVAFKNLHYLGNTFDLEYTNSEMTFTLTSGSTILYLTAGSKTQSLTMNQPITVNRGKASLHSAT